MWNDALPRNGITNWSVFTRTPDWQSWIKPAGCSWIYVFAIGAGGSAGRFTNGASTAAVGGGGSGSVTRILVPASLLPDILYVRAGAGGVGVTTAGTVGSAGQISYLAIAPNTTAQNLICTFPPGNGSTGGGTGGTGASAATSASGIWINVSLFTSIAGQAGANAAQVANAAGSSITFGTSGLPVTGGSGGGNGTGNGGDITGSGLMPTISGGVGTTGGSGNSGFRQGQNYAPGFKLFPLLFSGGTGGGGHTTGTAGNGGNGGYGCGGGGGGSTSGAGTSGNGGSGGDALILIGAF
jgi:hypothetical protein